jgi:hypothetical protein
MSDEEKEEGEEFPTLFKWPKNRTQEEVIIPADILESLESDKVSSKANPE